MSEQKKRIHPLTEFHKVIKRATKRFAFTHHPVISKDGLIITAQGFARPFYHKPTNTVGILASKTANNLEGDYAQEHLMERCYIFSARRLEGDPDSPVRDRPNSDEVAGDLRDDLDASRKILGSRSRKHYTLFGADNLFTNGRHMYEIVPKKNRSYDVILRLSTHRKDGGFLPFDLNDKSLSGFFSYATRKMTNVSSRVEAEQFISAHWEKLSEDLWENRNIFLRNGKTLMAKKLMADFANAAIKKLPVIASATACVGGIFSIKYGVELGVIGGLAAGMLSTLLHTVISLPVEFGVEEYSRGRKRAKELKSMQDIDSYDYDTNVADHFKIQTPENLSKFCPHVDLNRFNASDFEFLSVDELDIRRDREQIQNTSKAKALDGHLIFMGQRGTPSQAMLSDDLNKLRKFRNGVVRYMHEKENGNMVLFAQYQHKLCTNEKLRLDQEYIDAFEGSIVRLEYDRRKATFSEGLVSPLKPVSYTDMMNEIERDHLFRTHPNVIWAARHKSYSEIAESFVEPMLSNTANTYKNGALCGTMRAFNTI